MKKLTDELPQTASRLQNFHQSGWAILLVALSMFVFLLSSIKIFEDDVFWHLATGRWILQNGTVPDTDVFGYLTTGQTWIPFEWGWDVLTYMIYSIQNDYVLLQVFNSLLWVSVFLILALTMRSIAVSQLVAILIILLVAITSFGRMSARPQIISLLSLAALCALIFLYREDPEKRRKLLYLFPAIFLLWSNMHPGFLSGLTLVFLWIVSEIFLPFFNKKAKYNAEQVSTGLLSFIFALCLFASLLTPHGFRGIQYILSHTQMDILSGIEEWTPPFQLESRSGIIIGYAILLTAGLSTAYYSWKTKILFPVLSFIAFGLLSLKAVRFLADFAVVSAIGTAISLQYILDKRSYALSTPSTLRYGLTGLLIILILTVPTGAFSNGLNVSIPFGYGIDGQAFPLPMFKFMKEHSIKGKPFHDFGLGGLLIWEFPGEKNFIDSRNLNDNISNVYLSILNMDNGFETAVEKLGIEYMMFHVRDLRKSAENMKFSPIPYCSTHRDLWKLVYWDDNSFLYLKNIPKFAAVISQNQYSILDPYVFVFQPAYFDSASRANATAFRNELNRKLHEEPNGSVIHFIAAQSGIRVR